MVQITIRKIRLAVQACPMSYIQPRLSKKLHELQSMLVYNTKTVTTSCYGCNEELQVAENDYSVIFWDEFNVSGIELIWSPELLHRIDLHCFTMDADNALLVSRALDDLKRPDGLSLNNVILKRSRLVLNQYLQEHLSPTATNSPAFFLPSVIQ